MHFDFTINLGSVATIIAIIAVGIRIDSRMSKFMIEHEILVRDYCERKGIKISDLPTRGWR